MRYYNLKEKKIGELNGHFVKWSGRILKASCQVEMVAVKSQISLRVCFQPFNEAIVGNASAQERPTVQKTTDLREK